jgi:hypothetical protein
MMTLKGSLIPLKAGLTTEIEMTAEFIILLFPFDSVIARQGLVLSRSYIFLIGSGQNQQKPPLRS